MKMTALLAGSLCPAGPAHAKAEAPKRVSKSAPGRSAPSADETSGPTNEIQVTLFGQVCLMNGPLPRPTLTLLHEVSPERVPPTLSTEQMKKIREKLAQLKNVPAPIEQYREHLRRRLSAKIALEEALAAAARSPGRGAQGAEAKKAFDTLLKNIKEHVSTLQFPAFEAHAKKALEANGGAWNEPFIESLRERYEEVIQPETQEEFHKAIRLSRIQYVCSFDEGDERPRGEESE